MTTFLVETTASNKLRAVIEILAIDFERGVIDFRDPIDGVCRAPLGKIAKEMPTTEELSSAIAAVFEK